LRGRLSLYEARGEFQLIVDHLEAAGEGALRQALEALKQRLAAEGLFDPQHKKPLPPYPQRIGILSSPSGAALHDVLTVLQRRFPSAEVILYPIPVQGEQAPGAIVEMLRLADRRQECDLLILTRGGGSLEDLMAFNDEKVARTLATLKRPIVSAVGHEIDTTLADLAADRRAPTPSAAAELVSPDRYSLLQRLDGLARQLQHKMGIQWNNAEKQLQGLERRLQLSHPERRLQQRQQRLDELSLRLEKQMRGLWEKAKGQHDLLAARLTAQHPDHRLNRLTERLANLEHRLRQSLTQGLRHREQRLSGIARQLDAVSPLATLDRGYAIASTPEGIVRDADQLSPGDRLSVRFAKGQVETEVL
jgi:exodeoxyribonuclease VII large subunit